MVVFECPYCQGKMQTPEEYAGKTVECPSCKARMQVPGTPPTRPSSDAITADPEIAPAPAPVGAITTPDKARASKKRDDDDDDDRKARDDDDRPRRRDGRESNNTAAAAVGMSVGMVIAIVVGVGGCVLVGVAAILVALLVPAVAKVREAAARTQTMNNMKQIAIAHHGHNDTYKHLPSQKMQMPNQQASVELSWRVKILPFIEQDMLFKQIDQSNGWEHANNSAFINSRPMVYDHVLRAEVKKNETVFQYFTGPGTLFPDPQVRPNMGMIPDGTSNTFLFAEAQTPVPWMKPADMVVTPNGPLPLPADRFLVGMADGTVRMLHRQRTNDAILRLLIQPNDGQALPPNWDN